MRYLTGCLLLSCAGCFFPTRQYALASDLSRPSKGQLVLWPDDAEGEAFRYLWGTGDPVGWGWASCIRDLIDVELDTSADDVGAVVVLVPLRPNPQLLHRSVALLDEARVRFPNASFHHVRVGINLSRLDRKRHLLARLREEVGRRETGLSSALLSMPWFAHMAPREWVLTARETEQGVEWVRISLDGPPEIARVGDLESVLSSPEDEPYRLVFFLRPQGAPDDLLEQVTEAYDPGRHSPGVAMIVHAESRYFRWGENLDDDAVALLYPLRMAEVTSGPLHFAGILSPENWD